MKKWKEYTRQEQMMIIAVIVLLIAVLLSWGRVTNGFDKGMHIFFHTPADTLNQNLTE